jgi:serine/threonine protein kinase
MAQAAASIASEIGPKFEYVQEIGRGSFGVVVLARDATVPSRPLVAIKLLPRGRFVSDLCCVHARCLHQNQVVHDYFSYRTRTNAPIPSALLARFARNIVLLLQCNDCMEQQFKQAARLAAHHCSLVVSASQIKEYRVYVAREILHHGSLVHPFVIAVYSVFLTQNFVAVVMEYAAGGDMFSYLKNQGGCLHEQAARFFFQQLILGLQYVHGRVSFRVCMSSCIAQCRVSSCIS